MINSILPVYFYPAKEDCINRFFFFLQACDTKMSLACYSTTHYYLKNLTIHSNKLQKTLVSRKQQKADRKNYY